MPTEDKPHIPQDLRAIQLPRVTVEHLLAPNDDTLRSIATALRPFRVSFRQCDEGLSIGGDADAVALAAQVLERIGAEATPAGHIDSAEARRAIDEAIDNALKHDLAFRMRGLHYAVRPLSLSQVAFMQTLRHDPHELIFGVGPTGTGKTHLAVAAGLNLLAEGKVKHIILTRPHSLAEGQTMTAALRAETVADETLTPFMDELQSLISLGEIEELKAQGKLQIIPPGLMRGRTFNDTYIVIDDAQNLSVRKMRMALTRLGAGSRMVVLGDPAHADLHEDGPSGLGHVLDLIADSELAFVYRFEPREIIRHELVAELEALYERAGAPAEAA